ncbi:hypothetical protein EWX78_08535 [Campylobacter coli]|uniref:Uncharacterized protein n=1 Tax=Campylobacter coli TaxID=195 RepID=A0A644SA35_CAMCO|nr:hypothetical protein [Campylobacter coli]EAI3824151.1 hypothetical protein [Campylobacter coli]EAJ2630398.1 hypothetical protein [Campylobacter coli]EAJ9198307.1 hypothetical protein [Campylobacter coli]EAJ9411637.1 hypothetical protein [Campylobacter coli]
MKLKIDSMGLIFLFMIIMSVFLINIECLIKPAYNELYRIFFTVLPLMISTILFETRDKKFIKDFYNFNGIIVPVTGSFMISIILSCFIEFNDSFDSASYAVFIIVVDFSTLLVTIFGFCKILIICEKDSYVIKRSNNINIESYTRKQSNKILIIDNIQDDLFRISISD